MNKQIIYLAIVLMIISCQNNDKKKQVDFQTICNPIDLSYRFSLDEPSRREAADPTVVFFQDKYFLFASKSGGYWYSDDLVKWEFIETNDIPTEEYAPTAIEIKGSLYFLASSTEKSTIYTTSDPMSGQWTVALDSLEIPVWDPAFFLDDDDRLYLYWGCSDKDPIYGVELDFENNFSFIGEPKELFSANTIEHGWEVPGDYNSNTEAHPWIEGAWMNKHNERYYLQYSGPGTEFKSYSDGVYIADSPLGPYAVADHNPFAYKPEGYASAAGHGSTFKDKYGNYWHMGTSTISIKHIFERRLVLYPAFFDRQGLLYANTKFGDYPYIIPTNKIENINDINPEWMLLSFNKQVDVSSSIDSLQPSNMTDENMRSYWAAKSGSNNEYASIDLGETYDVYSVQINFAEHNTDIYGRQKELYHQYILEHSNDNTHWELLIDKSQNLSDNSHDYTQLEEKINCQYLRIKNIKMPGGSFALSGFRVFGKGNGDIPKIPLNLVAIRNKENRKSVSLQWDKSKDAIGYNISYGIDKNKLYHNYTVHQDTSLTINSLNVNNSYYYTVESFNENGISKKGSIVLSE